MPLFRCYQDTVHRTFVIELSDEAVVKRARCRRGQRNRPLGSWHLEPNSIEFFDNAPEVFGASVVFMEEHLGEVAGTFLPRSIWCPWNSRVIEEVFPARAAFPP